MQNWGEDEDMDQEESPTHTPVPAGEPTGCDDNDKRHVWYVTLYHHTTRLRTSQPPILVVVVPTRTGWTSRSTSRSYFNHDYVNHETFEDISDWLKVEGRKPLVTQNRAEALEFLATPPVTVGDHMKTGDFECDPTMDRHERAEKVLQHLESSPSNGWPGLPSP